MAPDDPKCLDMSQDNIWEVFWDLKFLVKIWSSEKAAGKNRQIKPQWGGNTFSENLDFCLKGTTVGE